MKPDDGKLNKLLLGKEDARLLESLLIGQKQSWVGLSGRGERLLRKARKYLGKEV